MSKPLRILHLEDSPSDSDLAREHLAMGGIACTIQRVDTREEFLAALGESSFDLIFADYELPGFDGLAAFALARERCPDTPFIILTGKMGEDLAIDTLKGGVTDYVLKQRISRLAPAVNRALRELLERARRQVAEMELRKYQEHLEQLVRQRSHELEERNRRLADANKDLEMFVTAASHDLRTPLVIIGGFANRLATICAGKLETKDFELIDGVIRNTDRMEKLIGALQAFFRFSSVEPNRVQVDMNAVIREVLEELAPLHAERKVEFTVAQLPRAYSDAAMTRQVLTNLISNAIKFSAPRKLARIEIDGWEDSSTTYFSVRDNGVGFDMRFREKLFESFERLHDRREFAGSGLGLAIVQRVMQRHGGSVWATGVVDEGAVFTFALPKRRPPGIPETLEASPKGVSTELAPAARASSPWLQNCSMACGF